MTTCPNLFLYSNFLALPLIPSIHLLKKILWVSTVTIVVLWMDQESELPCSYFRDAREVLAI
jgi:hypothetical protein